MRLKQWADRRMENGEGFHTPINNTNNTNNTNNPFNSASRGFPATKPSVLNNPKNTKNAPKNAGTAHFRVFSIIRIRAGDPIYNPWEEAEPIPYPPVLAPHLVRGRPACEWRPPEMEERLRKLIGPDLLGMGERSEALPPCLKGFSLNGWALGRTANGRIHLVQKARSPRNMEGALDYLAANYAEIDEAFTAWEADRRGRAPHAALAPRILA